MICCILAIAPFGAQAATRINVGDNFQTVVNANPTETVFIIASGTHREQEVQPNNGTTFIGENGAMMKGSRLLDPAAAAIATNANPPRTWYKWTGISGVMAAPGGTTADYADPAIPGHEHETFYGNELFVDGARYRHVDSLLDADTPGEWYFDYPTDTVYMSGNPAGHTIELSTKKRAFNLSGKSNIRIENLSIWQYASVYRPWGPIEATTCNYITLRNLDCSYNHTAGGTFGPYGVVENCRFTYNGQIGLVGTGQIGNDTDPGKIKTPVYLRNNEFAFNKQLSYKNDETGTFKVVRSNGGVVENNWGHDNPAWGMWWDVYNQANIIRSNLVEGGTSSRGIFYEISGNVDVAPTQIYWNTIKNQADTGIDISSSPNCWVYENAISQTNTYGIRARDGNRSADPVDPNRKFTKYRAWGNDVKTATGRQHTVWGNTGQVDSIQGNTYRGSNSFDYFTTVTNFATWQGHGYDTNGTYTSTVSEPALPAWAKAFQTSQYGPLPSTLVGHWRLDESTGTTALNCASNSNNGTLNGNSTWLPSGGQRQGALDFEQDSPTTNTAYVDCGTAPGSAAALTVAFWMKAEEASRNMIPVGKSSGDSTGSNMTKGWAIKLRNDGDIKFRVGGEYGNTDIAAGPGSYGTNWVHVAATFSSGTAKLYVNGVLKATGTGITTRSVDNTTTPLRFGKNSAGTIEPYDGLLDDVQIYSSALSQAEIQGIMGTAPVLRPVGSWHLDDAVGTTAVDASGNGNTGTLTGSPVWVSAQQGTGLDFDGSTQYVTIPHSSSLNVTGDKVSLAAWIKLDNITGYRGVVSKYSVYELNIRDGHVRFELKLTDGSFFKVETTNVEIAAGTYYHVAAVRDGATVKIYVNGVSKPVTYIDPANASPLASNTAAVNIGRRPSGILYFDGVIDEVEVHDTALSAGDVNYLMGAF